MTDRLPEPPDQLPALDADHVLELPVGHLIMRAHQVEGPYPREVHEPRWYGPLPGKGRFDHHPAGLPANHEPHHGVVYAATTDPREHSAAATRHAGSRDDAALDVVLAELTQEAPDLHVTDGLTLSQLELTERLRLLDLGSRWTQQARAGTHLSTAPHAETQPWARAIRRDYPELPGVAYPPSTGGPGLASALNESAVDELRHARVALSRQFADPNLRGVVNAAAQRLDILLTYQS